ncbi:Rab geranylgeranyltransferase BET2 [Ascoidea rubescens DSM 1968]|uniref:Geranylgeranyl transferase type-2 subunit beta n=1 Tax=Ascoidea rubescens DSM 1968 TaxID=1344418 RepID=A0A1D2VH77_9ASCO|nr:terpenoid cyclases/Protein prenyltransferase [Ascoidea rubescens DSM 1968]ODV60986.1 terpenoid cyclases/Protein prenyltransferase [Ascoidea rubescens DSM 1968]
MAHQQHELTLFKEKHIQYIVNLNTKDKSYEYWLTEHLRMNGLYWGLTALYLLGSQNSLDKEDVISFVLSCKDPVNGGFGAFPKHDGHLLSTLSAIQILATLDSLDVLNEEDINDLVDFIIGLQLPNGSFQGDKYGEIDTRFIYTAISSLSILGKLTKKVVEPSLSFIKDCQNFDGGFGMVPGAESHAAQVFTCLGTLAILDRLDVINDQNLLGWWLSERQVANGGLNGRPEKLPDVCYSWWVLSSLSILNKLSWIDHRKLRQFILHSQDSENGGISDRPDNQVDVYHTLFGIAGLSLMKFENLVAIDPVYCMPIEITKKFRRWPYTE